MKERNLVLAPITVMVVSDGIPDVRDGSIRSGTPASYQQIDLSPLDCLSNSVTFRLVYASPKVRDSWLAQAGEARSCPVLGRRVRRHEGWRAQMKSDTDPANQDRFWKRVRDSVDYRVRRGV